MKTLLIETFIDGNQDDTVKIPLTLAKVAINSFAKRFSVAQVDMIRSAIATDDFQGVILEVEEQQTNERVVLSIVQ
ncbi:hypothetical protein [uncultured Vibrio sp.]|uniref:hypothetical protein n=1 Tax=uncultured Vibrio sp. TaxID=114054 RepID=UPI00092266D6|nr:hypothetical protein [uncultured Vibrio sp.]OIQ26512.1 MAG: hypothetical protein BM561_01810 [Vibrio sp. MedPE-SWchi]